MPDPESNIQDATSGDDKNAATKDSSRAVDVSEDDSQTSIKENTSNTTVQGGNTVAQQTTQEELYDISDLIANSKALGYRKEVVTGALFNCEKTQMSKSELDGAIKKFLGKKVK